MRTRAAVVSLVVLPLSLLVACGGEQTTAGDPAPSTAAPTGPAVTGEATLVPSDTPSTSTSASFSPSPAESASTSDLPACSNVWKAGVVLDKAYQGCVQGGREVPADVLSCSSGQSLVRYDGRFYGVLGGSVSQTPSLDSSKKYLKSVSVCRG